MIRTRSSPGAAPGPSALDAGAVGLVEVVGDDLGRRAVLDDRAAVDLDRTVAELGDRREHVGDEEHGPTGAAELLHPPEAAALELGVPDREHLVDEHDLRLEVRGDGEREPHVHPARVALDRRVDEPLDTGELDDRVEALVDLAALHPEDRAVQVDVLATRELGMEARPDLEQAADAAADLDAPARGGRDPREHLEQGRLPAPFRPMTPSDLALREPRTRRP